MPPSSLPQAQSSSAGLGIAPHLRAWVRASVSQAVSGPVPFPAFTSSPGRENEWKPMGRGTMIRKEEMDMIVLK